MRSAGGVTPQRISDRSMVSVIGIAPPSLTEHACVRIWRRILRGECVRACMAARRTDERNGSPFARGTIESNRALDLPSMLQIRSKLYLSNDIYINYLPCICSVGEECFLLSVLSARELEPARANGAHWERPRPSSVKARRIGASKEIEAGDRRDHLHRPCECTRGERRSTPRAPRRAALGARSHVAANRRTACSIAQWHR
jgi:hypothetical protein